MSTPSPIPAISPGAKLLNQVIDQVRRERRARIVGAGATRSALAARLSGAATR